METKLMKQCTEQKALRLMQEAVKQARGHDPKQIWKTESFHKYRNDVIEMYQFLNGGGMLSVENLKYIFFLNKFNEAFSSAYETNLYMGVGN